MNLLFIIDPPEELKAYKDTTVSMMRAAQRRGHQVHVCTQDALAWRSGPVTARAARIALTDNDEDWFRRDGHAESELKDFGAVLMRKDPPFDMEYVASTWLLSEAERQGARVYNAPQALRDLNEKLAIAGFAQLTVPSLVTRDMQALQAFVDEHRDTVLKPLSGMGGTGIFRVRRDDPNRNVIVETLARRGEESVMAQRYIPEITEGDKRVIVIEGKPMPYVLARIPKAGETRGNLAAGGKGVARPLSKRDREIAEIMGPPLAARGIVFAGLDVIGEWLTEVNITSPTCFREIQDQTGFDSGDVFIAAVEARVAR
ncbi:MAG TPA: glutathione synthase [Burkholderiales bacterium]|nr:glutathione synthase [Burkholderiales bacterium]